MNVNVTECLDFFHSPKKVQSPKCKMQRLPSARKVDNYFTIEYEEAETCSVSTELSWRVK